MYMYISMYIYMNTYIEREMCMFIFYSISKYSGIIEYSLNKLDQII